MKVHFMFQGTGYLNTLRCGTKLGGNSKNPTTRYHAQLAVTDKKRNVTCAKCLKILGRWKG